MKRTVESLTPPENKQVMWLDVSGKVKQLKTYINGEWVIVNDATENNEEIVKEILGKIDKDFESYIKKEDADSKYVRQEVLDRDYVKSEYATKTYATIKELNNLSISLDSDYVKKTYADSNYVIKNTLDGYITKSYADNTYATKSTLEKYVTITDADTKYVSTETLNSYITADAISETYATKDAIKDFITTTTAERTYAKITSLSDYIKSADVENNYVSKTDTSYVKTDTLDNYVTIETANSTYATQTALADKVDKVDGKGLSTEDFTTEEKEKLESLPTDFDLNTKVDKEEGKGLSTNDYTNAEKEKLASLSKDIDISGKVDKEEGKGLSTNDFTNDFKTKLEGIAEGATKVIVDDTIKESTNAVQNSAVKKALDNKANNSVFTESANGLVPKADTTAEKTTAVLTAEGKWMPSYDASKTRTKRTFLAAPTDADGKAEFRTITAGDLPDDLVNNLKVNVLDLLSYGVSWKPNVGDPFLTRVGNMTYHRTLPIQNNMRGCIAQMKDGARIMYYLDPTDWRWREDPKGYIVNMTLKRDTGSNYIATSNVFKDLRYKNQWVRIDGMPCQVIKIDTSTNTANLRGLAPGLNTGSQDVELGAILNGYDGEVMVEVPEFWIKSWDTDTQREVRISPSKIDDTWEHQPRILISPYHDTLLNTIPKDMGYLSTLEVGSALSVVNKESYCRGGSNDLSYTYDQYNNEFKTMLGKPVTDITREAMRFSCRQSGKEILSYLQYKRILYWLYVIEYANFNCQAEFNSELTSEGFRQGGLGNGIVNLSSEDWSIFNEGQPLIPNGFTNDHGNNTYSKSVQIFYGRLILDSNVPRWHGIENPFGDILTGVDGIIATLNSIVEKDTKYSEIYVTDDPKFYTDSDYSNMKRITVMPTLNGYIKEWNLGNTAEIIPRLVGGNVTQYKCDNISTLYIQQLSLLWVGGLANYSDKAGLGYCNYNTATTNKATSGGYRSVCVMP